MPKATPRKGANRRATPDSSDSSDSDIIEAWSGDPIEKPAFLASVIASLEDEAEADHLITFGTVVIKDREYVTSLDHSDNLDAGVHTFTWQSPSPVTVTRHPSTPMRAAPRLTLPPRSSEGEGADPSEAPPIPATPSLAPSLPAGRSLGPGQISKLDQDLFARVAKRISDTSKRKEYREKSGKSLRALITVLTAEVKADQANSPAVRQVLGKRRDRLLKKPLAVPTNDCFNRWKSEFTRLNQLTTGTAHKTDADLATIYYNKVTAISSELSTRLWTEVRLTNLKV